MKAPGDLAARTAVAVVGIPAVIGAIWGGGWWLGALMGWAAWVGVGEFCTMLEAKGGRPFRIAGGIAAVLCVATTTIHTTFHEAAGVLVGVLVVSTFGVMTAAMRWRWPEGEPTRAVTGTLAGVLYVGLPLSFVPVLRAMPERALGPADLLATGPTLPAFTAMSAVLLPLIVTWVGDASAYFTGHAIGRHKLAPTISPGKTIEGSIGGLIGAVAASVLIAGAWIDPHPAMTVSPALAAGLGLALGVATQLGDLVESLLKREAGVKDSGTIFPGHGGMLDRLDALLWAFPVTWVVLAAAAVGG